MRSSSDRLAGYRSALEDHGLSFDDRMIRNSEWTFDGGYTVTRLLLAEPEPPTAIFAGNDEAAYGVIYAAQELGVDVPRQLSVCGYDDLPFSKNIWPGLTTVHQPLEAIVETATRLLIQILKGQKPEQGNILVPPRLVIRGSTTLFKSPSPG
jgi:LacI family xylobiose transport system transcriptional regulator